MFEEFPYVFAQSRAPWILTVGAVFAAGMLMFGEYWETHVHFEGMFAPLADSIGHALHERYGKATLAIVGSSFAGAWKSYRKERKRLFG